MAQKYYAAADIGGTKVALGLFGEDKTLVGKGQFASDPGLPGEAFFTQVVEELKRVLPQKIYRTVIPRNVRLSEAPSYGQPVLYYDRGSRGSQAYEELAEEFLQRNRR